MSFATSPKASRIAMRDGRHPGHIAFLTTTIYTKTKRAHEFSRHGWPRLSDEREEFPFFSDGIDSTACSIQMQSTVVNGSHSKIRGLISLEKISSPLLK